jgi:hypothetical protein
MVKRQKTLSAKEDDELFELVKEKQISKLFDRSIDDGMRKPSPEEIQELGDTIDSHAIIYPGMWPPQEGQRRRFIKLSRGVRVY